MRRIAENSGHAVQTIYNLVGSRDQAICEAISEHTRHVGRSSAPKPEDPWAILNLFNGCFRYIESDAQFFRTVTRIFFSDRDMYYSIRDDQIAHLAKLIRKQQKLEIIRSDVNINQFANQLSLVGCSLFLEWSDRPFPLDDLRRNIHSTFASLLMDKLEPPHRLALDA